MSRADAKRSKQARRAREDISRGIRRKDVSLALEGLLGVTEAEAAVAELDEARRWLAHELQRALALRAGTALDPWLTAGSRLPALLARLGLNDGETRWGLLWAAAGGRHWKTAELMLATLEPMLHERAEELAVALSAIVTSRGALAPDQIPEPLRQPTSNVGAVSQLTTPRARHGSPPATAAEAEQELIDCYATEPWSAFSTIAYRWLHGGNEPVASAIALTVAELAALELSSTERTPGAPSFAVVELLLAAVSTCVPQSSDARERRERALLLALRVVLGTLTQPGAAHPPAGLIASAVRAALATPLRESVALALTELAGRPGAALPAQLVCELHGLSPTPLLWARAALTLDAEDERRALHGQRPRRSSAEWLQRTLTAHLADPDALQQSIASLASKERQDLLSMLAAVVPPELAADTFFALWSPVNLSRAGELANFAHEALEANTRVTFCSECSEPHVAPFDDLSDLSAPGKRLFDRVGPVLAAHDARFLSFALDQASKRSERLGLLVAFAHEAAPIDHYVIAIESARSLGLPQKPFREKLGVRFRGRVLPLARGLGLAVDMLGIRSSAARELAAALLDAAATAPAAERTEHVLHQLRVARRITGRERRRKQLALPFTEATS